MMNPNYLPPGNNNTPINPLGYPPTTQDFNGLNNSNNFPQMPMQKPFDQDMAQKMQNMNINGPQGFPTIPTSQLPPGQLPPGALPPTSNFGQVPPTQNPPSQQQFPPMGPKPPGQPPTSGFNQPPPIQTPNLDQNNQFQQPPTSMGPPRPGQPPQVLAQPPSSQPQPPMSRPAMHPTPGQFPKPAGQPSLPGQPGVQPTMPQQPSSNQAPGLGLPPSQTMPPQQPPPTSQAMFSSQPPQQRQGLPPQNQSQPGFPPQIQNKSQPGFPPQSQSQAGFPPHSQSQPGLQPQSQPSFPPQSQSQPGFPPQSQSQSGFPQQSQSQTGFPPQQGMPGVPPQPNQLRTQGLPPQPSPMPGQPGLPPQQNQGPPQQSLSNQPGMPPKLNQLPGQMPPPGQMQQNQPGMPPKPNQVPGMPSMPSGPQGFQQPGLPPQPQQPGLPPQPQAGLPPTSQYNQYQTMPGLPHMPPPQSQQRQYPGAPMPPQQQFAQPPAPNSGYGSMPPQPQQPYPPSGYPPQYQGQFPAQQPSYPGQQYQQAKKLDPDQMPSPIQVMAEDQANRGGVFVTNEKGQVPPLVTTDFVVDDKGNSSPRYIRSSMYSVPATADLLKQTAMPFCVVISPLAETVGSELEPPLLDFAALTGSPSMGPVRCTRCKAYMCPNMKFIDAGRHFKCAFCKATTEVPMEYTQYINSMQQYGRVPAEMALGTYEIVATKEYCRNNTLPNPPAIVFLIDVSYNSVKSGMLDAVCENVLGIIEALPKNEQTGKSYTRVGFITYSSTVHFYNIKGTLAQPQLLSVGDVSDMFVPILEGFLETLEDSGCLMRQLLEQLPSMFRDNKETETILLPAVQAGLEALKAADTSGQLIVFHTTLPTYNAPGKLVNREDRKLLGTDKEKQILAPQTTAYNELGQACCAAGVSVELFVCNNAYVDCATIGQLPRLTGGQLHKYTYFTCESDGARLIADLARVVTRPTAHDAVMRVRTSTGVRATEFYGHLFMSNTTDVELAAVDPDKAVGIEIKHDDKLTQEDGVYIQAALLYTHRDGSRRLRILNLALNVAQQLADVYRSADMHTILNVLFKQAVWNLREHSSRQLREALTSRTARCLAAYRRHCASPSSAGQLVLPESMKLMPLYTNCVLRHDALTQGPDITCDERSCAMFRALTADVLTSLVQLYPRLLELHTLTSVQDLPPKQLRASVDKMQNNGVYLLENGVHMLLWIGSAADPEYVQSVFGVPPSALDTGVSNVPPTGHPANEALLAVLEDARVARRAYMRLTIMRQHDKLETVLRHFLVEDRGVDGSASYVDYLCHIHKEIRALL